MPPAKNPGLHIVIHGQPVIGVVITIDHQVPGLFQHAVAIPCQVPQLQPLARSQVLARHRLDSL